jgi:hypothetical protein
LKFIKRSFHFFQADYRIQPSFSVRFLHCCKEIERKKQDKILTQNRKKPFEHDMIENVNKYKLTHNAGKE